MKGYHLYKIQPDTDTWYKCKNNNTLYTTRKCKNSVLVNIARKQKQSRIQAVTCDDTRQEKERVLGAMCRAYIIDLERRWKKEGHRGRNYVTMSVEEGNAERQG